MSDMLKCPFCQQELDYLAEDIYGNMYCPNCRDKNGFTYKASESIWQELTKTKQALDVAADKLKDIKACYDDSYADPHFVNWHIVAQRLANDATEAIDQIKQITESPAENVQSDTKSRPVNVQKKMSPEEFAELELLVNATFK